MIDSLFSGEGSTYIYIFIIVFLIVLFLILRSIIKTAILVSILGIPGMLIYHYLSEEPSGATEPEGEDSKIEKIIDSLQL